ncbi:hypothetical protein ACQJBY_069128 [Aegilops geniculata]
MDKRWRVAGLAGRCRTDPVRIGRWRRAAGAGQWDLLRAVLGPLVRQNSSRSGMAAGSCIDTNYGCLLCILPPRARPVFSAPFPSRPSSLRRSPLSPSIKVSYGRSTPHYSDLANLDMDCKMVRHMYGCRDNIPSSICCFRMHICVLAERTMHAFFLKSSDLTNKGQYPSTK